METMYDKLGDLLNETLKSGQVKFKKKMSAKIKLGQNKKIRLSI